MTDERPTGWYRDPENPRAHRYWNGHTWTVSLGLQADHGAVQSVLEPLDAD